jgi:CRISPR-associated protein Cmr2
MSNNYLFIFTLGPVQYFIAQARKTRDLHLGSMLLSDLIHAAIIEVENNGGQVVFPSKDTKDAPNRLLALVQTDDTKNFGRQIENIVRTKFLQIALDVYFHHGVRESIHYQFKNDVVKINDFKTRFEQQINDHLEIFWAFQQTQNSDAYSIQDYQYAEQLLGAVKRLRPFKQHPEQGRKCSLDGERNAMFLGIYSRPSNRYKNNIFELHNKGVYLNNGDSFWQNFIEYDEEHKMPYFYDPQNIMQKYYEIQIQENEGLSAVSFVKRFYKFQPFDSTASIALKNDIKKAIQFSLKEVIEFKNLFMEGEFDDQLFYEENLTKDYFYKNGYEYLIEKLLEIKAQHQKIKHYFKNKYYAIIAFDGDDMGKWLSGYSPEKRIELKDQYKENIKGFHVHLSTVLGAFSVEAKRIVDASGGQSVYSGGDDFLGFLNINTLFDVLAKLKEAFKNIVSKQNILQPYLKEYKEFTFSAGICIAHYAEPLNIVLNNARNMEMAAKSFSESKDCFGISILKGSGEEHQTIWKNDCAKELKEITHLLKNNDDGACFSDTFIKSIQVEFAALYRTISGDDLGDTLLVEPKLFEAELKRLVFRSCQLKGKQKLELSNHFSDLLLDLFKQGNRKVSNFFECLNICNFISRQISE